MHYSQAENCTNVCPLQTHHTLYMSHTVQYSSSAVQSSAAQHSAVQYCAVQLYMHTGLHISGLSLFDSLGMTLTCTSLGLPLRVVILPDPGRE